MGRNWKPVRRGATCGECEVPLNRRCFARYYDRGAAAEIGFCSAACHDKYNHRSGHDPEAYEWERPRHPTQPAPTPSQHEREYLA
jgi:hypothetical protein